MKSDTDAAPCWRVGVHASIAGSIDQAAEKAHELGCTAFQIFSTNPRLWKSREPTGEEIAAMARLRRQYDLYPLVIHVNYLVNLASPEPSLRNRSLEAFQGEVRRAAVLGAEYLVLHPGSYRNSSPEQGIRTLTNSLREAWSEAPPDGVTLLVENTCGQGNVLGGTFAEVHDILALLDGIPADCCIDTAHCFAAGMDLASPEGLEAMVASLRETIGLDRVKLIHANDSRAPLGSHRDRHEHIGRGGIGRESFRRMVNHPALRDKVFILETPLEQPGDDRRNLRALRSLRREAGGSAQPRPRKRNSERLCDSRIGPRASAAVPGRLEYGKVT